MTKFIVAARFNSTWNAIKRNNELLVFDSYKEADTYVTELKYSSWKLDLAIVEV